MQIITSCIMILLMICLFCIYVYTGRNRNTKNKNRLRRTVFGVEWILLSGIATLLVRDRQYIFIAFSSYYIAFAWFLYLFFCFCVSNSKNVKSNFYKLPVFCITIIETIMFVIGIFEHNLFTVTHIRWFEHSMWATREFDLFYIYFALCLCVIISVVSILLIGAFKTAKIYRLKNFSIIIVVFVETIICCFVQISQEPLCLAAISLAIGEIIIIYMAVYFAPRRLKDKALLFSADKLNDGIVLFNEEHRLQFVTDNFCQALGISDDQLLSNEEDYWKTFLNDTGYDSILNGRIKSVEHGDKKYFYDIYSQSFDEGGKSVGTVYWIQDVTDTIENYERMVYRANFDEFTDIYNEAHFYEVSRQVINDNPDIEFLIICSNVEKFKVFCDLFGKETSMEYIKKTAQALKEGLSRFPLCRYCRYSEDGFFILMPKEDFIEKDLLDAVNYVSKDFNTSNYILTVNLGIYEIVDKNMKIVTMCNRASMACEAAKGTYKNNIVWFSDKFQRDAMLKARYNAELTNAIETGEIRFFLQPQVDSNGNIIGAEALARWLHKDDGLIPPVYFIPTFEENGRITELDICIWRQACQKLREWKEKGRDDLYISVNISAKDLYALDIYDFYMNLIEEYGISAKNLKLEITESSIINDLKKHIVLIDRLQEAGFEVEMDDFGSAYSSFNMLKDICVDVLKIDMKFLGETENEERSRSILKSIIDLSKELNMKTVAEGVETEGQFEFLKNVGCDIYQGYYFSRPVSVEEFEKVYLKF